MCRLLIAAIFAAAMWPVAAYANQTLAAFSPPSSSPVVINACGASLSDTSVGNVNYYVNNAVKFTNTSDKPVVAVRFRFDLLDAFAQPLRTLTGDVTGYFFPGVLIEPHYNITAERFDTNVWSTININPNIAEVRCSVELVRFEGDSTWSPAAQVASGSIQSASPKPGYNICDSAFEARDWQTVIEKCPTFAKDANDAGTASSLVYAAKVWSRVAVAYAKTGDDELFTKSRRLAIDDVNEALALLKLKPNKALKEQADMIKSQVSSTTFKYDADSM